MRCSGRFIHASNRKPSGDRSPTRSADRQVRTSALVAASLLLIASTSVRPGTPIAVAAPAAGDRPIRTWTPGMSVRRTDVEHRETRVAPVVGIRPIADRREMTLRTSYDERCTSVTPTGRSSSVNVLEWRLDVTGQPTVLHQDLPGLLEVDGTIARVTAGTSSSAADVAAWMTNRLTGGDRGDDVIPRFLRPSLVAPLFRSTPLPSDALSEVVADIGRFDSTTFGGSQVVVHRDDSRVVVQFTFSVATAHPADVALVGRRWITGGILDVEGCATVDLAGSVPQSSIAWVARTEGVSEHRDGLVRVREMAWASRSVAPVELPVAVAPSREFPGPVEVVVDGARGSQEAVGNAFEVAPRAYITAAHVLGGARNPFIRWLDGTLRPVTRVGLVIPASDIAVLAEGPTDSLPDSIAWESAARHVSQGAQCQILMKPSGSAPIRVPAVVSDVLDSATQRLLVLNANAGAGSSGAPVVDAAGNLLGVVSAASVGGLTFVAAPRTDGRTLPRLGVQWLPAGLEATDDTRQAELMALSPRHLTAGLTPARLEAALALIRFPSLRVDLLEGMADREARDSRFEKAEELLRRAGADDPLLRARRQHQSWTCAWSRALSTVRRDAAAEVEAARELVVSRGGDNESLLALAQSLQRAGDPEWRERASQLVRRERPSREVQRELALLVARFGPAELVDATAAALQRWTDLPWAAGWVRARADARASRDIGPSGVLGLKALGVDADLLAELRLASVSALHEDAASRPLIPPIIMRAVGEFSVARLAYEASGRGDVPWARACVARGLQCFPWDAQLLDYAVRLEDDLTDRDLLRQILEHVRPGDDGR